MTFATDAFHSSYPALNARLADLFTPGTCASTGRSERRVVVHRAITGVKVGSGTDLKERYAGPMQEEAHKRRRIAVGGSAHHQAILIVDVFVAARVVRVVVAPLGSTSWRQERGPQMSGDDGSSKR